MQWDNGVRFEEMASGEQVMDPSYIRVPSGTGSEGFYSHNGEEFIYVISGRLFVELKDHGTFQVAPGTRSISPPPPRIAGGPAKSPSRPSTSTPRRRSSSRVPRPQARSPALHPCALRAVSPDGKWVAWSWSRLGPAADVFAAPTDGSQPPLRLTETVKGTRTSSPGPRKATRSSYRKTMTGTSASGSSWSGSPIQG